MREDGSGRGTVPPWGHAQSAVDPAPVYAVGDRVYSHDNAGTVHAVGPETVDIQWDDGDKKYGAITYPIEARYLRKARPWET